MQIYVNQHDFFINRVRENTKVKETQLFVVGIIFSLSCTHLYLCLVGTICLIRTLVLPRARLVCSHCLGKFEQPLDKKRKSCKLCSPTQHLSCKFFCSESSRKRYARTTFWSVLNRLSSCHQIQQYLEFLLNKGAALSDLSFLRILQLVHAQTSLLVEDLKAYEISSTNPRSPVDAGEFRRSLSGPSSTTPATAASLGTMLEVAMEELFVPYTEGQRYLERESRSLGALYSGYLDRFTRYHVQFSRFHEK